MGNAKGSLKDRLRYWKNMRKEKKRKKQEELEAFRIEKAKQGIYINPNPKKYNRIQVWMHSFIGIIVGIFSRKKEDTVSPKQLLQEINVLEQEVEKVENLEEIPICFEKVMQKEKIIKQIITKQNSKATSNDTRTVTHCFQKMEMMKQEIRQKESTLRKQVEQFSMQKGLPKESLEESKIVIKKQSILEEKIIEQKQDGFSKKDVWHQPMGIYDSKPNLQPDYRKHIIDSNQKIKLQREKLKQKKEEWNQATTPQELFRIESEILWIQKQLEALEKDYQDIFRQKEFQYLKNQIEYYCVDQNDLLKDDQSIRNLILECKQQIEEIEKKAKQTENIKEKRKKEEPKKEEKKKQQKEYYLDVDDFTNLRMHIMEDLKKQVSEFNLTPISTPQNGFFTKLRKFISNTIVSIMPIYFFKNKLVGILTSTIVAHNRIRSMRQLVTQEQAVYETGEKLFTQIESKQDCLQAIQIHLNGSLTELEQLKSNFILKYQNLYPTETEMVLLQMNQLEQQLIEKSMSLQLQQRKMVQMKRKYQKIMK